MKPRLNLLFLVQAILLTFIEKAFNVIIIVRISAKPNKLFRKPFGSHTHRFDYFVELSEQFLVDLNRYFFHPQHLKVGKRKNIKKITAVPFRNTIILHKKY